MIEVILLNFRNLFKILIVSYLVFLNFGFFR